VRDLPLKSRVALVTGVSRRAGIGFAIAKRLASLGADLCVQSFAPYDAARLVAWLATDDARWVTGQVIASTGGGP